MKGVLKVAATVATMAVAIALAPVTGGATLIVAIAVLGVATTAFALGDVAEGMDNYQKAQNGDLRRGHNFMRDDVFGGNDTLYSIVRTVTEIAFGLVTSHSIGSGLKALEGVEKAEKLVKYAPKLKTASQVFGNTVEGAIDDLIQTGSVNLKRAAWNTGLGLIQGSGLSRIVRDGIGNKIMGVFEVGRCSVVGHAITAVVGGALDTGLEKLGCSFLGQPFDAKASFLRNLFINGLDTLISDPVDAVTGGYVLHATDFILASLPMALKLERTYYSTEDKVSVLGRGWGFPYASRFLRDTKDSGHYRLHLETITGHSVCFEQREEGWVNISKGASRFLLEVRDAGESNGDEEECLLKDVVDHTLCVYDRNGLLRHVEYPNHLRMTFTYGREGLERISTPLGNVLEVESREGRILQIADEIGRRTLYRYEGDLLVDVVHADEGITHYEYDEKGYIVTVTDQNGSCYLRNEYDERGRVIRQDFSSGAYQTFTYDDADRRSTVKYSENGKLECYEYNDRFLKERTVYEDGTCETYEYSEDNLKTGETSRLGFRKEWEYDAYGRMVRELLPDGHETRHAYDENHDMVRTWDSDGRETQFVYDENHNVTLTREKIAEGQWKETAREYDALGRCVLERDAVGNETVREYDLDKSCVSRAYPSRVTTPKGEETVYGYDRVGRRMSVGNAYGTVELSYNSRNFVTKRKDGEGHTSCKIYDLMGNLVTYYPPVQWESQGEGYEYRHDFLERVVDTITPLKEHRRMFLNFDGDVTRRIHPVSYAERGEDGEGVLYEYDKDGNLIRIRYSDGGVERRFYDADGRMLKQIPPEAYDADADNGAGYTYGYDAVDRLVWVRDAENNLLHTYEYNGCGQVTRKTDGEGKETLYTYNGLGLKIKERTSVRKEGDAVFYRVASYTYDLQGNRTEEAYGEQEVEKDGEPSCWHRIRYAYDGNNRLTQVADDFGARINYAYDCLGNVTLEERAIEEGIHSKVTYAYNRNGWRIRKTEEIQGNGDVARAVTEYGYDANGNLVYIRTPKGYEIFRTYDADDRLTEKRVVDRKNGIDRREKYAYDEAGNLLKREILGTDGERLEDNLRYDLKNRVTHRITPAGAVTRYLYDRNDRLVKETLPYDCDGTADGGAGMTYAYDSRGNRVRTTNALGELVQEVSYNLQDKPVALADAFGNRTGFYYTEDGELAEVRRERRAGGAERENGLPLQKYEYNARGQITGIVDGNGERVSYDLDGWGRITGIGFSDGVKERYEYTPAGRVGRATDGNGHSVQYLYNSLGKVRERVDQVGEKETFLYDAEGNLSLHIDRDGRRVHRAYNVYGDPVYEKAMDAEGKASCVATWHYDSIGRLTRAVCDGHSYEYAYDECGNLKEKRSNGQRLVSYTYNRAGQMTGIKNPAGVSTRYEYDLMGRRSRAYNDGGLEVRYAYDSMNRLRNIRFGNGVVTSYAYDGDGNLSFLETRAGEEVLMAFAYAYDGNGNRVAKTGVQRMAAGAEGMSAESYALDIHYGYDIRGQLLEEKSNGESTRYAYDKAGNRTKKVGKKRNILYLYDERNRLQSEEDVENGEKKVFLYDRQGSIIKEQAREGVRRYFYNSRHQQTRVEVEDGRGQTRRVQENRYDAEGLRFELTEDGKRTGFVYHNGELLYEKGGGDQEQNQQVSYHLGVGIDASQGAEGLSYFHRDEQLSTALLTGGRMDIQNSYQYDAFGNMLEEREQFHNRIRYTGQQYDDLTGQYYLRARYYNPILGRFMQEDTYWGDGISLYVYCHNNPVLYSDPSGYAVRHYSMDTIQDVLDYFNQLSSKEAITKENNSWNSFQKVLGGKHLDSGLVHEAYGVLMSDTDGHYIHRNKLSQENLEALKDKAVAGLDSEEVFYEKAKAMGIKLDVGHATDYEFWRTRNAAESLGWTQAQYDDFMSHNVTKHYQYEKHEVNISHIDENHSSDVTKIREEMLAYQKEQEENGNWERDSEPNGESSCSRGT